MRQISPVRHYHNLSCVYQLRNISNDFVYIGSTTNLYRRWYNHKGSLNRGVSTHTLLQEAWTDFGGEKVFVLEILEKTTELLKFEQFYIDKAFASGKCYNVAPNAGTCLGKRLLPQTMEKLKRERPDIFEGRRQRITEFNSTIEARMSRSATMSVIANTPEAIARSSTTLTAYNKSEKNRQIAREKIIAYNASRKAAKNAKA